MTTPDDPRELPPFDLMGFLPYLLAQAAETLSRELAQSYREEGITTPQWRVLVHLSHAGTVSVRDIERRVAMEKSKVSRAAARLETAGLIEKAPDPEDRRLVALSLTPAGRALMARLLPRAIEFQAALATRLGPDLAPLRAALQQVLAPASDAAERQS